MGRLYAKDIIQDESGYCVSCITGVLSTAARHDHDYYEIFLILEGQAIHWRNQNREVLFPGTAAFVLPGDSHSYSQITPGPFRMLNIAFSSDEWDVLQKFLSFDSIPWLLDHGNAREALEIARKAEKSFGETELDMRIRRMRVLAADILSGSRAVIQEKPEWLLECLKPENLERILTGSVSVLKEITGFSSSYLTRAFKKHTGLCPSAWIARERLAKSVSLLLHDTWDIASVAQESGYENLSHFYRQFKAQYGMSPGKFRRDDK
ncbi:MAG: AraC family transcriptional regulator [Spirochaetales bacterium]|nr:AraC family transcriptional regulator [Spirochaetales bacterium]